MGEELQKVEKGQGCRTDLVPSGNHVDEKPTLSDLGITKKQSHIWQQLAAIPQEEIAVHIKAMLNSILSTLFSITLNSTTRC
jgi:hypothetical protein